MNEVRHVVRDKVAVSLKPLEDDEKRICDLVLCGEPVTKAYIEVKKPQFEGRKEYLKISQKANGWIKTKRVQKYLADHRKTVRIIVEQDMEALAAHMYDIAMGNAKKEIAHYDKDLGRFVKDEISPAHSDQIAAAAWMKNWYDDRKKDTLIQLTDEQAQQQKEIEGKAMEFLSFFKKNKVQDGVFRESANDRILDMNVELMDAEGQLEGDVNPDVVKSMIGSFAKGDDEITDRIMENYARSCGKD